MSKTTSRRSLLKIAAGGGIAAGLGMSMKSENARQSQFLNGVLNGAMAAMERNTSGGSGPLSTATVTFGAWAAEHRRNHSTEIPNLAPLNRNVHLLIPDEVTIQSDGVVNFIVQGAHQIAIYDHGTRPDDIDITQLVLPAGFWRIPKE